MEKSALITGGTRGLGKATAFFLKEKGVRCFFLNYVQNKEAAENTKKQLEDTETKVFLLQFNLAFPQEISKMFEQIKVHVTRLDFFVHAAAITVFKPTINVRANQWDLTMNVSTRSFLNCTQQCLPLMKTGSSIVAISGTGSRIYTNNYGALGIAKAALEAAVRYLAVEAAQLNICINAVVPGLIANEAIPPFPEKEKMLEKTIERTPAKGLCTDTDVARLIWFLLAESRSITGQSIVIDGGLTLT